MDDPLPEEGGAIDWSYQGRTDAILRGRRHPGSNFERAILIRADLGETDFSDSNFKKANLREADLMKSAFDNCDFRGADLRKAKLNISNFRNCKFKGADLRGVRGRYAIWEGSDWWNAKMNDDLIKALSKKWRKPDEEE
ncbi:MAG: pentapeptide repeat-containing protein [Euryarchaeota archaeon]|jgi:uncharacterized protein YjbI with pentapeptide repeats|nr:pentapeptide repeat-containing protein [Euryarchaeota archaeon]